MVEATTYLALLTAGAINACGLWALHLMTRVLFSNLRLCKSGSKVTAIITDKSQVQSQLRALCTGTISHYVSVQWIHMNYTTCRHRTCECTLPVDAELFASLQK